MIKIQHKRLVKRGGGDERESDGNQYANEAFLCNFGGRARQIKMISVLLEVLLFLHQGNQAEARNSFSFAHSDRRSAQ
jgi:hypothetical protein